MIILITLLVLFVVGKLLSMLDRFEAEGEVLMILVGVLFFVAVFFVPVSQFIDLGHIEKFKSVQVTINNMRKNNVPIESAAIQITIAESNAWLASSKYYNQSFLDIYIPDKIESLEFLK